MRLLTNTTESKVVASIAVWFVVFSSSSSEGSRSTRQRTAGQRLGVCCSQSPPSSVR
jgi:hypothetical protein